MLVKKLLLAVDRHRKMYLDFVCGDRSTRTGLKLLDKLKDIKISFFCSDHWHSYSEMLPLNKLIQDKKETYTVEGFNCRVRHYLARFKRRGLCYSKSIEMIEKSLKLLFLKLNYGITILE